MSHKKKQQSIEEKKFENKTSSIPAADLIKQKTSEILTENPVDKILDKSKEIVQEEPKTLAFYFDYKIWVFIIIAIILSLSISLNTLFFKKIDLKFFAGVTLVEDFFINHLEKPFVVTIGEFKTVE